MPQAALLQAPAERESCNWMGLVQRVQRHYRVWHLRGFRDRRIMVPQAWPDRDGRGRPVKECPTLAQGPAARGCPTRLGARGLGAGGDPQQPAWSEECKQREESGVLRRPRSCPVRPGYTRAYGITGPEGETCRAALAGA